MFGLAVGFDRVATIRRIHCSTAWGRRVVEADPEREFERQAALIKALRQEMNERRLEGGVEEARLDFLCECLNPGCRELVSITLDECEFVRKVPNRLVVRVGHADYASERVLMEEPGRFQVVERFESADDVVAHLAPWAPRAPNRTGRAA
jgi:hypothetical protein